MKRFTCYPCQTEVETDDIEQLPYVLPSKKSEIVDFVEDEKGRVAWVHDMVFGISVDEFYHGKGLWWIEEGASNNGRTEPTI